MTYLLAAALIYGFVAFLVFVGLRIETIIRGTGQGPMQDTEIAAFWLLYLVIGAHDRIRGLK